MAKEDPYEPGETKNYECMDCGHRVRAETFPGPCPECDGEMLDLSLPQE